MAEGIFPDVLKVGKITPVFKKGTAESIENYRPISTLPIFGKFFEKMPKYMFTHLYAYEKYFTYSSFKVQITLRAA